MADVLQLTIVTTAAAGALALIVRPYVRRSSAERGSSCPSCPSGKKRAPVSSDVRPLRLIRR